MSKLLKNIICIIGISILTIIVILNIVFNTVINAEEIAKINLNNWLILLELVLLTIIIYLLAIMLKRYCKKIKKKYLKYLIFGLVIFIYVLMQVIWINVRDSKPIADQDKTYQLAIAMKENRLEDSLNNSLIYEFRDPHLYFERYSQQFTLAFIWSIMFKILNSTDVLIPQYFNIFSNALLAITIFLITGEISKKYKVNKYLSLILYLTFMSLPLLATFVYGDFSGLSFAMLGVYFIMKYTRTRKIKYAIFSSISTAFAYMLRMNILIFILAMIIYLILDLISKKENLKQYIIKILVIIGFITISILPASLTKTYFCNRCGLDESKKFPIIGYIAMGMNESDLSPGWFSVYIVSPAYNDIDNANEIYMENIKETLNYMKDNPLYALRFYIAKTSSMWTETTFAGIRYNISSTYAHGKDITYEFDENLMKMNNYVLIYQKALLLIICTCSIIVIIQNRKNISNELILLLTIFIGGFLFHTLWEAKSRYIIPYIIALIPITSVEINKIKIIISKRKEK